MERLQHSVRIHRPLEEVYRLARQVERYPEFLPGYKESRILEQSEGRFLLARAALIDGKMLRWKSWVEFAENESIAFEQVEGPLKGMRVYWEFHWLSDDWTRVTITHRFQLPQPFWLGRFLEKYVYKPKLDRIASLVVIALKQACEARRDLQDPLKKNTEQEVFS